MREVLEGLVKGRISIDEAERLLRISAIEEIGNLARIDVGREFRKGVPEIILAEGKKPRDIAEIALRMLDRRGRAVISRASKEQMDAVKGMIASDDVFLQVNDDVGLMVI
ncbi:MAG: nickel pincer cofactor biosynthesis protein LarB, partial [Candidatus Bathyarchaeia archaeon]